jgi:hypothetical protein
MAIARKPLSRIQAAAQIDVDALINKGGTPAAQASPKPDSSVAVVLRVPGELLGQIDAAVKARTIRTPRHTWLLEALHEKLTREQTNA